jgi:glycosyltransferase involved in cell wall biosynthesis
MPRKRHRILFVQKQTGGGSMFSLYELVRGLSPERYEAVVLFHDPTAYHDKFRAIGAQVLTLDDSQLTHRNNDRSLARATGRVQAIRLRLFLTQKSLIRAGYRSLKELRTLLQQDLPLARRMAQLVKDQDIDLIHHNNCLRGNRGAILAGYLAHVPQVLHIRMSHDEHSFADRYVTRFVDRVIYVSEAMKQAHAQQNIPTDRGVVIHNPIDVGAFQSAHATRGLRAELGLEDHHQIVANVGRLDTWKGHDDFIEAIAKVVVVHPNVKALIVGDAGHKAVCQAYYRKLQELVGTLNLSHHVTFTGYRDDIPGIMAMSDIIVHSASKPEPFGRVVAEGLASGKPVIATAAGGVLEIIENKVTGLLVPPRDPTAMAKAIHYLFCHPTAARQIAERAQKHAQIAFPVERHTAQVQEIYAQLLSVQAK